MPQYSSITHNTLPCNLPHQARKPTIAASSAELTCNARRTFANTNSWPSYHECQHSFTNTETFTFLSAPSLREVLGTHSVGCIFFEACISEGERAAEIRVCWLLPTLTLSGWGYEVCLGTRSFQKKLCLWRITTQPLAWCRSNCTETYRAKTLSNHGSRKFVSGFFLIPRIQFFHLGYENVSKQGTVPNLAVNFCRDEGRK